MTSVSAARRDAIVRLTPTDRGLVVDVGADHGHVAHALGAIATERAPHRAGRPDVPWVIADGLRAFRAVPVAVIAGMGAHTIARIVAAGPRPDVLIAHCPDDPGTLRALLTADGYRIDAEELEPEGPRFAHVIRFVPGVETASGLTLHYGPTLLASDGPHHAGWLRRERAHHARIAAATAGRAPQQHAEAAAHVAFLDGHLAARGLTP